MSAQLPSWAAPGHPVWRIGHRGAAAYCPHNTLTSFRKAAELGADWVELDVVRTRDHEAAVIHDLTLRAANGALMAVSESTLAELQRVDLGGGERVPALPEVLKLCAEVNLNAYIELKDGAAVPQVIAAVFQAGFEHRSIVSSFRPDWLANLKAAAPGLPTTSLFSTRAMDGSRAVSLARASGATYLCPGWESDPHPTALLTPAWLGPVRAAGLGIISWHEERPDEIAALLALGVDGICSDRPELVRAAL
jgi:glycerophosphoryl diester phosphodiesterase